jgi:hypothetical protein
MSITETKPEFLSFLYRVLEAHPSWAREAISVAMDGSISGYQKRVQDEMNKRAGAEVALAMAHNHLKKGIPQDQRNKIEHVLAHSFMFEGTEFAQDLKKAAGDA